MAVYTDISDEELDALLDIYDIGQAVSCKGVAEGVENSNFMLQTDRGDFFLTLYEKRVRAEDLPFFLGLIEHLHRQGQRFDISSYFSERKEIGRSWFAGISTSVWIGGALSFGRGLSTIYSN